MFLYAQLKSQRVKRHLRQEGGGGEGEVRGAFLLVSESFEKQFNLSRSSKEL